MYRAKLVTAVLAYGCLIGGLIGGVFYYAFPDYFPQWFEGVLAFFLILETLMILLVEAASRKASQRQLLNTYLLTKVIKIFASLLFVGAYYLAVNEGMKSFVLTFISFYLLYLIGETLLFMRIEKRLKKNK